MFGSCSLLVSLRRSVAGKRWPAIISVRASGHAASGQPLQDLSRGTGRSELRDPRAQLRSFSCGPRAVFLLRVVLLATCQLGISCGFVGRRISPGLRSGLASGAVPGGSVGKSDVGVHNCGTVCRVRARAVGHVEFDVPTVRADNRRDAGQ